MSFNKNNKKKFKKTVYDFGFFYKTNFDKLTKNTIKYIFYISLSVLILYKISYEDDIKPEKDLKKIEVKKIEKKDQFDIDSIVYKKKLTKFITKNKEKIYNLLLKEIVDE